MHRDSDADSQQLAAQVELLLAEYDSIANASESELRRQILDLVNDIELDAAVDAEHVEPKSRAVFSSRSRMIDFALAQPVHV